MELSAVDGDLKAWHPLLLFLWWAQHSLYKLLLCSMVGWKLLLLLLLLLLWEEGEKEGLGTSSSLFPLHLLPTHPSTSHAWSANWHALTDLSRVNLVTKEVCPKDRPSMLASLT